MRIEYLEGKQTPPPKEFFGVELEFNPERIVKVPYTSLWGNSASSKAVMSIHTFHNSMTGIWWASTSPGWYGMSWVEVSAQDEIQAIRMACTENANQGRRQHSLAGGPWEGNSFSPEYGPLRGEYFPGAVEAATSTAAGILAKGGIDAAKVAVVAVGAGKPGWRFPKGKRK